jgi:hypothetical protein
MHQLEKEEEATFGEDDGNSVPPNDIVAYNELRSCADIFRMYRQGVLDISPEFQRDVVWPSAAQTRFIDSLVKQLPIPSMCFALDYKQGKWIVIDGLQRISSIVRFLSGKDWRLSRLDDIDPALSGLHVSSVSDPESKNHYFYAKVENLTIPITVLRCDLSKRAHEEFLFTIWLFPVLCGLSSSDRLPAGPDSSPVSCTTASFTARSSAFRPLGRFPMWKSTCPAPV